MDLFFLITSFIAGMLTVLAPCVVVILPIVLGSSAGSDPKQKWRVITGLSLSILIFSILLKATTALIAVPQSVWAGISGGIVAIVGLSLIFPSAWLKLSHFLKIEQLSQKANSKAFTARGGLKDYAIGASLGPVFSACSPTYALVVALILPEQPVVGFVYLSAFVLGLAVMLIALAYGGQRLITKLNFSIDAKSPFRRIMGIIFLIIGVSIAFGLDKELESALVENGWFDWQVNLEDSLRSIE